MKPASQRAIEAASQLLLDSVVEENDEPSRGPSDESPLVSLHRDAEYLAAALQSVYGSLSKRLADKRRQRNAQTPIYRLPLEILVKVFLSRIAQIKIRDHVTTLHNLARVSYLWASIIRRTPALWAFLSSDLTRSLFQTVLKRSQNTALTVNLGPTRGGPGFNSVLEACKHVSRWGSASLTLHVLKNDIRELLEQPAPQIAHINITAFSPPISLNLFGGRADHLTHLQLNGVAIPLNTPMISGLTHLELRNLPSLPSIEEVIRILRSSPLIHSLTLGSGQRLPEPSHMLEAGQPLILEHLRTLRLFSLPHKYLNTLLRGLRTPACQQLTIQSNVSRPVLWPAPEAHEPPPLLPMDEVVGPCFDTARRVIAAATKLRFRIAINSFALEDGCGGDNGGLLILLTGFENTEKFVWFTQRFKDELKNKPITINLTQGFQFDDPLFFPALQTLTNVEALGIESGTVGIRTLFTYLSDCIVENDVKRWHLPGLRELVIESPQSSDHQQLVSALQRRYGLVGEAVVFNGGPSTAFKQELPHKLDVLRVACRDQAMQEQFRSIVGSEAFSEISPMARPLGAGLLPGEIPVFNPGMGGPPFPMGQFALNPQGWGVAPPLMDGAVDPTWDAVHNVQEGPD